MGFLPLELMRGRIDRYGGDSDSAMFTELLYAGEFVFKITAAAFISAIEDDRENHRYRLLHGLYQPALSETHCRLASATARPSHCEESLRGD